MFYLKGKNPAIIPLSLRGRDKSRPCDGTVGYDVSVNCNTQNYTAI
ncbi:MAG: hypothetical protein LBG92_04810 [Prevotellaceae bacterium]|nr:hypothetical protein [Prevotellaceae bacterium]